MLQSASARGETLPEMTREKFCGPIPRSGGAQTWRSAAANARVLGCWRRQGAIRGSRSEDRTA
eukprot:3369194-Rhodomonas_salina.2